MIRKTLRRALVALLGLIAVCVLVPVVAWLVVPAYNTTIPLSTKPVDTAGSIEFPGYDWEVGSAGNRFAIRFHVGEQGIAEGGGIKVSLGHVLPTEQRIYTPFSLTVPSAVFFRINLLKEVQALPSRGSVKLAVEEPSELRSLLDLLRYVKYKRSAVGRASRDNLLRQIDNEFALRVRVVRGRLEPGDFIQVGFGLDKGLQAPKREARYRIITRLDGDGDGTFGLVPDLAHLDVFAPTTARVVLVAPSTMHPGERNRMVLRTEDDYFLPNLSRFREASVTLEPAPGLEFPLDLTLRGVEGSWEGSLLEVPLSAEAIGLYRIRGQAVVDGRAFTFTSNPIDVVPAGEPGIYFGDTHLHSVLSYDADRPPSYVYWRQRHQERHDFATLSDHDMIGAVPFAPRDGVQGRTPGEWTYMKRLSDAYNTPGEFVTLHAYEWTSYYYGHRNIYFAPDVVEPPLHPHNLPSSRAPTDERSPGDLQASLRDSEGAPEYLAIPHSPAWPTAGVHFHWGAGSSPAGGTFGDPTAWPQQRLLELYSTHGASEYYDNEYAVDRGRPEAPTDSALVRSLMNYDIRQAPADSGNFARDALGAGWRFGFIGSSDMHYLSHLDQAYKYGLAAVVADALTRQGIWDGLSARRTYATTGVRILLRFTVDGVPMGGEVALAGRTSVQLQGWVAGVSELERIEIIKFDGARYVSLLSDAPEGALDRGFGVTDDGAKPGDFYYARVRQRDGNYAWSSPVWLDE